MAEPFPNPESDLDRLRAFLEKGAETTLETIETFPAAEAVPATVNRAGTVAFDITAARLVEQLAGDEAIRVLLDLGLGEVRDPSGFYVHVFLNTPEATVDSSAEEPGFLGGISFFCEPDDQMPEMACPIGDLIRTTRLDVTEAIGEVEGRDEAMTASLVLVPAADGQGEGALTIRVAELSLVRSSVTIAT